MSPSLLYLSGIEAGGATSLGDAGLGDAGLDDAGFDDTTYWLFEKRDRSIT